MQQARLFQLDGLVAGIDEAGRGPLAGPVVAAAVILDADNPIEGLADSKKLSEEHRERLAAEIRSRALSWSVGWANPTEIDDINILAATMVAMRRAIEHLSVMPDGVQVDGNRLPNLAFGELRLEGEAIVGGDGKVAAISAASIIAKTTRDGIMRFLDRVYPDYEFARHKGYGTSVHLERLQRHGPCVQHRNSFAPVRAAS
ncbi:MAG TPA: ribonuclease HII [Woeseiaceae bacterium]|nr:ribonuclease HII [Woeseiaceae bacterium]